MRFANAQNKFAAVVIGLMVVGESTATVSAETIKIRGVGATTCADWTKVKNDPALPLGYGTNVQWVLGFLSAFSHFKHKSLLQNTDYDAVAAYVDNKCKLKPLADIMDVAVELGNDLAK
jgi:hypothetical protein